ncbi:MAG: cobalamin biosynthesis protein CbiM [Elusimicrobia bacterium RIFOXYA2_FULL_58_8]|nr:MAG: cobalamin biosynthesis protein CbiM [Elusimicrobia bacterium RIFOXYA12_FULL_57_11]OGS12350.1 MAG: cobalamin biosynthesis protein CbiM [Elusimicrobia bacterium RIFOXYA2_FULL_58_8]
MHMADALLSPAVGGTLWVVSGGLLAYSAKKVREEADDRKVPLMGVLGAFIFAAQMINFTIPATGSSGHLGGGLLLSILLGHYAAFLVLASALTVQALFFADGGLLALGCNMLNLGFFPCFVAYPFIYKKIAGDSRNRKRVMLGATLAALAGLQLGAFGVVLQTVASSISSLPFKTFVLLMQPIHLAIGLVEGLVTAGVVSFMLEARPEIVTAATSRRPIGVSIKGALIALATAAAVTGGALSWLASTHPDGLEWAMFKTSGKEELESGDGLHRTLAELQGRTAFLPDYGFKRTETATEQGFAAAAWPAVDKGTSVSGLVGGLFTLLLAGLAGFLFARRKTAAGKPTVN